ncbi:signal peptide peptidase SppA [Sphingosinicella soli]|uniref:Protease-4 n=1 Tax=Sphingosinicella soli TaxID=333708 RepID=A0A7W7B1C6_9SPHN|nr:signal peptide peptidase SppA [Sphingosinicella soli]MBB4631203.1 protease-4 [Sphingosinicella soli]
MAIVRGFWRFLVGIKDALALLFLLFLLFGFLALRQGTAQINVPQNGALVLNINGYLVDQATDPDPLTMLTGGQRLPGETEAGDVIHAINAAATDKRITSLVLDLDGFWGGGLANLQSIGSALNAFKTSGKKVYAFSSAYLDDGYYLAAHANEVWLAPLGAVLLTGPGGSGLYFKDALDKLKVDVNVFRVGTFKSAVEPFTRAESSPEAKSADQALVDSLWETWMTDVSTRRKGAPVRTYMQDLPRLLSASDGGFAQAALKGGMVDHIGTRVAFGEMLAKTVGTGDAETPGGFNGIGLADYHYAHSGAGPISSGDAVGIVYVSGEIVDGEAPAGTAGGETISGLVNEALADDSIKALVVRIDSPGGSVTASEQIREALMTAKAQGLPVVASFGPVAASGGYWIATAADEIYAQPSTITGSIGVFAIIPTFQRTLAELGVHADGVKSTPFSGAPDVLDGITPEVGALLQASVEDMYGRFLRIVGTARKLPVERVDEIGQGRVWDGGTARQLKLVDHFGGLDAAVAAAAKRAGLPKEVRTVEMEIAPPIPLQILNSLFSADEGESAPPDALTRLARTQQLRNLSTLKETSMIASGPSMQARCIACAGLRPSPAATKTPPPAWLKWLLR